jgi:hypothetical protein
VAEFCCRKPKLPENVREFFRRKGREGGKLGGPVGGGRAPPPTGPGLLLAGYLAPKLNHLPIPLLSLTLPRGERETGLPIAVDDEVRDQHQRLLVLRVRE